RAHRALHAEVRPLVSCVMRVEVATFGEISPARGGPLTAGLIGRTIWAKGRGCDDHTGSETGKDEETNEVECDLPACPDCWCRCSSGRRRGCGGLRTRGERRNPAGQRDPGCLQAGLAC